MATYKGFNTQGEYHKFRTTDFNLIKHDLLNHFNIRYGEKLMKPTFGCGIWNYLFDPFTSDVTDKIIKELAKNKTAVKSEIPTKVFESLENKSVDESWK